MAAYSALRGAGTERSAVGAVLRAGRLLDRLVGSEKAGERAARQAV